MATYRAKNDVICILLFCKEKEDKDTLTGFVFPIIVEGRAFALEEGVSRLLLLSSSFLIEEKNGASF